MSTMGVPEWQGFEEVGLFSRKSCCVAATKLLLGLRAGGKGSVMLGFGNSSYPWHSCPVYEKENVLCFFELKDMTKAFPL